MTTTKNVLAMVLCFFECLFFGGTIYGWASMAFVLKKDKVFAFLCSLNPSNVSIIPPVANESVLTVFINGSQSQSSEEAEGCGSQDKQLSLVFTAGTVAFTGSAVVFGLIFDRAGLRWTRVVGSICGVSGYLLMAFAGAGVRSWLVYPGVCCLSMSCIVVIMTNCHVARLAGSRASTLIGVYIGAINMAIFVFLVVKLLQDRGVPRVYSLCGLTCFWIPYLANTFFLLPKDKISPQEKTVAVEGVQSDTDSGKRAVRVRYVAVDTKTPLDDSPDADPGCQVDTPSQTPVLEGQDSCWDYLLSPMYPIYVYWWATMHVRFLMFLATFNPWVTQTVNGDLQKVSHFTDVLGYTQLWTIVISPLAGWITDLQRRKIQELNLHGLDRSIVCVPSLAVASVGAILLSVTVFLQSETSLYASIIISELYRFPAHHYGTLFGLCRTIAGTASFIQYPYTTWGISSDLGYLPVNILLLVTVTLSLAQPGFVTCRFLYYRRKRALHLK